MTYYPDPPTPPDPDDVVAGDIAGDSTRGRGGGSAPLGAFVVNWRTLGDQNAPGAWNRLRDWVEWFTVRYNIPLSTIPTCWWKHSALVEELSALHTAHTVAHHLSDTGNGPVSWHERLTVALPRLTRAYAGGCARGHTDTKPRTWAGVTDEQEWAAWTSQAHAHQDATRRPH